MSDVDYNEYLKSKEWESIVKQRLEIDRYTCQMCGTHGNPENPLECHHFTYRNLGHEDVWTDVVTVCNSCHGLITRLMNRTTNQEGRAGWSGKRIPRITVYTINGYLQEHRKEQLNESRNIHKGPG